MTNFKAKFFAVATIATMSFAGAASALTLESTLGRNGLGNTGSITGEWGGAALMKNVNTAEEFIAWCIEPFQTLQSQARYVENDFLSASVFSNLDKLFTLHYADVDPGVETQAFSIAIWDIVYDGGQSESFVGLDDGYFNTRRLNFYAPSSVAKVNEYLTSVLAADDSVGGAYTITQLQSRNSQDLIVATQNPAPVPLPAAGLLLGTALIALKRMRKAA